MPSTPSRKKKIRNNVLYVLVLVLIQEVLFRALFPIPEIANFDRINYMLLYFDGRGSAHSRNQAWEWRSYPDTNATFVHHMNQYGFRDKEWSITPNDPSKKRILFIGDSFIEGVMAEDDQTIPLAFEKEANGTIETMNGGLLGCDLDSYLQLAADMVPTYRPDVTFLCIYSNDLGKEIPKVPSHYLEPDYFNAWKPRLWEIFSQASSYGPLRARWKTSSKPYLQAHPDPANPWTLQEQKLKGHATTELEEAMKKSEINPFLTNALEKEEKALRTDPMLGESIPFFEFTCAKHASQPVIVYIPSRNQVTDYYLPFEKTYCQKNCPDAWSLQAEQYQQHARILEQQCEQFNIPFIDLTSFVREQEQKGNHLYWNYDQHFRAKGYALTGREIFRRWSELQ